MMMPSLCEKVVCFDLDDTLYKEKDYVESAFREVADYASRYGNVSSTDIFKALVEAFENHCPPFQDINSRFDTQCSVQDCLQLYRNHKPFISLSEDAVEVLTSLQKEGCILGLITDGRKVTQRNKIAALGLERFFAEENRIISEEFGSEKPSERNFRYFMEKYPEARYVYVGDNLKKDFVTPNQLGWLSVCLLDNGDNIHRQDFTMPEAFLPAQTIHDLTELVGIVDRI